MGCMRKESVFKKSFEPQLFICESNITLETDILSFVNEAMCDGLHCGQ